MTETEWAIRTLRDCVCTYVPGGLDAVLTHSEQERIRVALLPEHTFVPWIEGVNEVCSRCGLAATDAAGESCVPVESGRNWGAEARGFSGTTFSEENIQEDDLQISPVPFPPGALKPEWEGDPAHAQTVAATDRQIDGFNQPDGEQEWVIYFTNPATGARAQMFARLRPYPEMRAAPTPVCTDAEHAVCEIVVLLDEVVTDLAVCSWECEECGASRPISTLDLAGPARKAFEIARAAAEAPSSAPAASRPRDPRPLPPEIEGLLRDVAAGEIGPDIQGRAAAALVRRDMRCGEGRINAEKLAYACRLPLGHDGEHHPNACGHDGCEGLRCRAPSDEDWCGACNTEALMPHTLGSGCALAPEPESAPRDPDERVKRGFRIGIEAAAKAADRWEATYPEGAFPPDGTSLDAKAAGHGRHVAKMIAQDIRNLAAPASTPAAETDTTTIRATCPGCSEDHSVFACPNADAGKDDR